MINMLFFGGVLLYFIAVLLHFAGIAFKNEKLTRIALFVFIAGFAFQSVYIITRGIIARRLPLSNQFEFATAFAWGIGLICIVMKVKLKAGWVSTMAYPATFLLISYAALLPKEITNLMPALRSVWFGLHIGSAVFAYASFALAGCTGIQYLIAMKKGEAQDGIHMRQIDYFSYRLIALGILLLTVVILSGCIWAEQAWSSFWSWDPKETWALVTWIVYSIYLHQRLRRNWQGKRMAIFAIVAVVVVLFTFIGVNQLLPSLHSYV